MEDLNPIWDRPVMTDPTDQNCGATHADTDCNIAHCTIASYLIHCDQGSDRGIPVVCVHRNASEAIFWAIDTVVAGGPCCAAESPQSLSVTSRPPRPAKRRGKPVSGPRA